MNGWQPSYNQVPISPRGKGKLFITCSQDLPPETDSETRILVLLIYFGSRLRIQSDRVGSEAGKGRQLPQGG